jgi:hypothetical protein
MPTSVRLDSETENLLEQTASLLHTTKSKVLKASVHDFCTKTLQKASRRPYELLVDLIGLESSGKGDLAVRSEEILRNAFRRKI